MRHLLTLTALALASGLAGSDAPADKTHRVELNGHVFTLPVGFTIELAAKAPLVDRPIAIDLDDDGRLYVADSSGSNEKTDVQLQKKPHRIVRLTDTDGDGKYDKATTFADKMMLPQGAMFLDGSLFVAAPPSIWKLTDTDDDGIADKREEWFAGKTLTGCANDLHGPYAGPDGWIYWCKGAFAEQRYARPGKGDLVTKAAHVFRARRDGSGVEPVMTGGMDNPVDVVWTPSGERIFSTTFFQHPGNGLRDGLIHNVYGGLWGKPHAVLDNHVRTGPDLMPVLTHFGAAAPAGLHRYESMAFGDGHRGNLFAAQFNMAKVSRHVLKEKGATFVTEDYDFVVSSNRDFHPTDAIEDADGSLLIVDTGGWYKLCCPTSQLVKPDVLGAIYRVRKKDAPKIDDPRGGKIDWAKADVVRLLDDPRPVVRRRAVEALARRGLVAADANSPEAKRNAVWAATRVDSPAARSHVRAALADGDEVVRQAALHSVALWRDQKALPNLLKMLPTSTGHARRAAAEALGRIGDAEAVPALLALGERKLDRFAEHSIAYALIEIGDRAATAQGLKSRSAGTRRLTLTALEGIDAKTVASNDVVAALSDDDAQVRETAAWIAGRHPAWGDDLAVHFTKRLADVDKLGDKDRDELADRLARFAASPAIGALAEERSRKGSVGEKRLLLRALSAARLKEVPAKWLGVLLSGLDDNALLDDAVRTARDVSSNDAKVKDRLRKIGAAEKQSAATRVAALAAVPGTGGRLDRSVFSFLSGCVGKDQPVALRGPAAGVLSRSALDGEQLLVVAGLLKDVGPMELEPLMEPFAKGKDEKVGLALVAALAASPARSAARPDRLKARVASYPASVRQKAEALVAELDADLAKRKKQLDEVLPLVKTGDVRRGQAVFNNQKTACIACHAIGYLGGKIGPDLTRIGRVRDERDLLESILFPSASFVRSYEPVEVVTKRGRTFSGLIRRESADEVVVAISATEEVRVARKDVAEVRPGHVSLMPAGLEKELTPRQLADLVTFLKACQ